MMRTGQSYSSGEWLVKEGSEEDFVERWTTFIEWSLNISAVNRTGGIAKAARLFFFPLFIKCVERLSEKGYEQRSEREFGRYTEHDNGLWVVCRATLQAPPTLFGQFLETV